MSAFAAPDTIDTMPEKTLLAFAAEGRVGGVMPKDGGDAEEVLQHFAAAGVDVAALAAKLQVDGAQSFVKSWTELLQRIAQKGAALGESLVPGSIRSRDSQPPRRCW